MSYIFTSLGITTWIVGTSIVSGSLISYENEKQFEKVDKISQEAVQEIVANVLITQNGNLGSETVPLNPEAILQLQGVGIEKTSTNSQNINNVTQTKDVIGSEYEDGDDGDDDDDGDNDDDDGDNDDD